MISLDAGLEMRVLDRLLSRSLSYRAELQLIRSHPRLIQTRMVTSGDFYLYLALRLVNQTMITTFYLAWRYQATGDLY